MKTTRRQWAWRLIAIFMAIAFAGLCWVVTVEHELRLSRTELQEGIDDALPFTTDSDIKVSRVDLDLSGNSISLKFNASMNKLSMAYEVAAEATGSLLYENESGAFFFAPDEVKIVSARVNGVPLSEGVGGLMSAFLSSEQKAALLEKTQDMLQSLIQAAAQRTLCDTPVYVLPEDTLQGAILRVSLKSVEVKEDKLVVRLSFWRISRWVLLPLLALVIGVVAAVLLRRHPEWGTSLILLFLMCRACGDTQFRANASTTSRQKISAG